MTMTPQEREALVEAATTAFRPRDALTGAIRAHDAWHDLDAEGRTQAYEHTLMQRELEAAMDPEGLSSTARAVLSRLR